MSPNPMTLSSYSNLRERFAGCAIALLIASAVCVHSEPAHFDGARYVGSFHSNFVYVMPASDGTLATKLSNGIVVDVYSARERLLAVVRNNTSDQFAVVDPRDLGLEAPDLNALQYGKDSTGLFTKLLATANTPSKEAKLFKAASRPGEWVFVDSAATPARLERFYLNRSLVRHEGSKFTLLALLVVTMERQSFYFNREGTEFAAVGVDYVIGTPTSPMVYKDVPADGVVGAIWKTVSK